MIGIAIIITAAIIAEGTEVNAAFIGLTVAALATLRLILTLARRIPESTDAPARGDILPEYVSTSLIPLPESDQPHYEGEHLPQIEIVM